MAKALFVGLALQSSHCRRQIIKKEDVESCIYNPSGSLQQYKVLEAKFKSVYCTSIAHARLFQVPLFSEEEKLSCALSSFHSSSRFELFISSLVIRADRNSNVRYK